MSSGKGLIGRIEKHGQFYALRTWVRIEGEERSKHVRITICPLKRGSPGWLNSAQRECRAKEILQRILSETILSAKDTIEAPDDTSPAIAQRRPLMLSGVE